LKHTAACVLLLLLLLLLLPAAPCWEFGAVKCRYLEVCVLEDNPIKGHGIARFFHAAHFQECVALVAADFTAGNCCSGTTAGTCTKQEMTLVTRHDDVVFMLYDTAVVAVSSLAVRDLLLQQWGVQQWQPRPAPHLLRA
jgi:hypothetical protein